MTKTQGSLGRPQAGHGRDDDQFVGAGGVEVLVDLDMEEVGVGVAGATALTWSSIGPQVWLTQKAGVAKTTTVGRPLPRAFIERHLDRGSGRGRRPN